MISRDLVLATTALAGAGGDLDVGDVGEVQGPEEVLGLSINLDDVHVQSRHVWHEVHAALALLLLQLQGDAADGAAGDAAHEAGDETRDLVAQAFSGNDSHLVRHLLIVWKSIVRRE